MNFEIKLNMDNAEQEAVWFHDLLQEHQLMDLDIGLKTKAPEAGTMAGEILLPIITGAISGLVTNRVEWLFRKIWERFSDQDAEIEFSATCPQNGQSFTMKFNTKSEKKRDAAQAEFQRRFQEMCGPQEEVQGKETTASNG